MARTHDLREMKLYDDPCGSDADLGEEEIREHDANGVVIVWKGAGHIQGISHIGFQAHRHKHGVCKYQKQGHGREELVIDELVKELALGREERQCHALARIEADELLR